MRSLRVIRPSRAALAGALAGAVVLAGCASFSPQPGPQAEPGGRYVTLTLPITAVGDTQEHESTGHPLHDNDSAIDAYVEVTERPPEQPLFGRRILEWALHSDPDEPWLHLGDVMDLSCRSEAERMTRIFRASGRMGAVLPGNHDGLMFGIYRHDLVRALRDPGAKKWNAVCRRGAALDDARFATASEAFSKRDFIARYLTEHAYAQDAVAGLSAPPPSGEHRTSWSNPDPDAFVSAIEARLVEGTGHADSYIAQRLKLPRAPGASRDVILIGLDTNQSGPLVNAWDTIMGRSPGSMGHVRPDQISVVSHWVAQAARRGDIVVFAGHHNWRSLGLQTRLMLRELMDFLDHPLVYLSAHTHRGFWAVHREVVRRPLLELNVSSLSDWPIAWRRISFAYDEAANRLLVRGDLMPQGPRPAASDADLLAAWQSQACEASGFSPAYLRSIDAASVQRQKQSRGSLVDWLWEEFSVECESCELTRYEHAQSYQNQMLTELLQVPLHLGADAHELADVPLPDWCGAQGYHACINALLAEQAQDLDAHKALFRRKAQMVDLFSDHLDRLTEPKAKAYMTCRAVLATRIDFDATPEDRNANRSEANRRAEQFFRIEASIGMD